MQRVDAIGLSLHENPAMEIPLELVVGSPEFAEQMHGGQMIQDVAVDDLSFSGSA